jgi:hypothetical protein
MAFAGWLYAAGYRSPAWMEPKEHDEAPNTIPTLRKRAGSH